MHMSGVGNELATIIGYESSPHSDDMLQVLVRYHSTGKVQGGGQVPKPGTPWGLLGQPAEELLPVGTVVQF
jgi:hypothetical protein